MDEKELEAQLTLLDQLQSKCTGCGLCAEACVTFQTTGWEQESPRGRLHLAKRFLHGQLPPSSPALSTFDRCLGCQACEPLCPHHVPYRQIRQTVQELRAQLQTDQLTGAMSRRQYRRWVTLARRVGNFWWRSYGAKWLHKSSKGSFIKQHTHSFSCKDQPVLVVGCVQDLFQHDVIAQTLDFMQRLGHPVKLDKRQPCCGAIFERLIHGGEETVCYPQEQQRAQALQNKALKDFLKWLPAQAYFLAKGCQCFAVKQASADFDLYRWIESILKQKKISLRLPEARVVYYQPYCGQGKYKEEDVVWRLLTQIEGLTIKLTYTSQMCCGGYAGDTFLHPLQTEKMAQHIQNLPKETTMIVNSPDCWSLYRSYFNHVLYPIQLLSQTV